MCTCQFALDKCVNFFGVIFIFDVFLCFFNLAKSKQMRNANGTSNVTLFNSHFFFHTFILRFDIDSLVV